MGPDDSLIDALQKIRAVLQGPLVLQVRYVQGTIEPQPGEILLGKGHFEECTSFAETGLALNHKTAGIERHRQPSVSSLVANALPERAYAALRSSSSEDLRRALERMQLVVEDASPDTCLAFILLLCRVLGVQTAALPAKWIDYVNRWEAGDVHSTGKPPVSWGALSSALTHSYYPVAGKPNRAAPESLHAAHSTALLAGLRLCAWLLANRIEPAAVPTDIDMPELARARQFLKYEQVVYQQSIPNANLLQLLVPIADTDRLMYVDSYIATEWEISGSKKVFLRTDEQHAHFRNGFTLMALHRPAPPGSEHAGEITFSVDPFSGLHLRSLWYALEQLEDQRWEGARPSDKPRKGIAGYPHGHGPNEPWWDDHGRYTLLGSPRPIDGQPSSRIDWLDAQEVLWKLYNPGRELIAAECTTIPDQANRPSGPAHQAEGSQFCGKRLVMLDWKDEGEVGKLTAWTPTLQRYLAACSQRAFPDGVSLRDLPDPDQFDHVLLPGGSAFITGEGVLLLNHPDPCPMPMGDLRIQFERAARRSQWIADAKIRTEQAIQDIGEVMNVVNFRKERQVLQSLKQLRLEMFQVMAETDTGVADHDVQRFRAAVEKRWGLQTHHEALAGQVTDGEELTMRYSDIRTNRIIAGLTIFGAPAALFAGALDVLFGDMQPIWSPWGVNMTVLLSYLGLTAVGTLLLIVILRRLRN